MVVIPGRLAVMGDSVKKFVCPIALVNNVDRTVAAGRAELVLMGQLALLAMVFAMLD